MFTQKENAQIAIIIFAVLSVVCIIFLLNRKNKLSKTENAFRKYLVSQIIRKTVREVERTSLVSRKGALNYVATQAEKFKLAYTSVYGPLVINNDLNLYEKVVDDLCDYNIFPKDFRSE